MSVVMYIKPGCPYCQDAREYLAEAGEAVQERDATTSSEWKAELMSYTNNTGVVPTIVSGGGEVQVGFPAGTRLTRSLSGRSAASTDERRTRGARRQPGFAIAAASGRDGPDPETFT